MLIELKPDSAKGLGHRSLYINTPRSCRWHLSKHEHYANMEALVAQVPSIPPSDLHPISLKNLKNLPTVHHKCPTNVVKMKHLDIRPSTPSAHRLRELSSDAHVRSSKSDPPLFVHQRLEYIALRREYRSTALLSATLNNSRSGSLPWDRYLAKILKSVPPAYPLPESV